MDESLKVFGKSTGCEVRIGVHLLEIGVTERNDVFVRYQNTAATDITGTGFGFPLEGGLDFRGCDRPPKTRAKASPTVVSSLRSIRSTRPMSPCLASSRWSRCDVRDNRGHHCYAWYRPDLAIRDQQNRENSKAAGQDVAGRHADRPIAGFRGRGVPNWAVSGGQARIWSRGGGGDTLSQLFGASGGMADALASGASVLRDVGVQVPLRPHNKSRESGSDSRLLHLSGVVVRPV